MPIIDKRPFKHSSNIDIMNALRRELSTDYQRRVPEATKANIEVTTRALLDYQPNRNEFINAMINKVGLRIARVNSWSNPLGIFKLGMMSYGESIEETMVGLLNAYTYDPHRDEMERTLFSRESPEVQTSYHVVNRQNFYKLTIDEPMIRRAFASPDGLSELISQLMDSPAKSDNWDEYLVMSSLFRRYESEGGFFKVNIPDVASSASGEAESKTALRRIRESIGNLGFLSRDYNAARMPVHAEVDDLVLFYTPAFSAAIDVEALAASFNMDRSDYNVRTMAIREQDIGIEGVQAILTTKDFFVVADTLFETRSQPNPASLIENYFLHHHQVISFSRFVPAIAFTTGPGTDLVDDSYTISGVTPIGLYDDQGVSVAASKPLIRGKFYGITAVATPVPADANTQGVVLSVDGFKSPRSVFNQNGTILISPDDEAQSIDIVARSIDDETKSATRTVKIDGDIMTLWPNPGSVADNNGDVTP